VCRTRSTPVNLLSNVFDFPESIFGISRATASTALAASTSAGLKGMNNAKTIRAGESGTRVAAAVKQTPLEPSKQNGC